MRKSTKKKLDALTSQVSVLSSDTAQKEKTIKYLMIGFVVLIVIVFFFVFMKKRRR